MHPEGDRVQQLRDDQQPERPSDAPTSTNRIAATATLKPSSHNAEKRAKSGRCR